jgi:hypothetical protein
MPWYNGLGALLVGIILVVVNSYLPPPLSTLCYIVGIILAIVGLILLVLGLIRGPGPFTRV